MSFLQQLESIHTVRTVTKGGPRSADPIRRRRDTCIRRLQKSYQDALDGVIPNKGTVTFVTRSADNFFVRLYCYTKPLATWKSRSFEVPADKIDTYIDLLTKAIDTGEFDAELQEAEDQALAVRAKYKARS